MSALSLFVEGSRTEEVEAEAGSVSLEPSPAELKKIIERLTSQVATLQKDLDAKDKDEFRSLESSEDEKSEAALPMSHCSTAGALRKARG